MTHFICKIILQCKICRLQNKTIFQPYSVKSGYSFFGNHFFALAVFTGILFIPKCNTSYYLFLLSNVHLERLIRILIGVIWPYITFILRTVFLIRNFCAIAKTVLQLQFILIFLMYHLAKQMTLVVCLVVGHNRENTLLKCVLFYKE